MMAWAKKTRSAAGPLSIFAEALTARWMLNYSAAVDYSKIITIEPGKRSGKPCIRGMRITVQDVFEYLAGGMTEDQILEDFPELTREDINACFAFAADRERKLFVAPAWSCYWMRTSRTGLFSRVADLFPDSTHIKTVNLREADDFVVWEWAKKHGFTIVSKDTEFLARIPFESFSGLILEQLST
jgi:uncharacterized protein (DUF433 family)